VSHNRDFLKKVQFTRTHQHGCSAWVDLGGLSRAASPPPVALFLLYFFPSHAPPAPGRHLSVAAPRSFPCVSRLSAAAAGLLVS
jgi:hypothetical protein